MINGKPSLTHALEKALTALRYEQPMPDELRRRARLADIELLLVIRKLDSRLESLEKAGAR